MCRPAKFSGEGGALSYLEWIARIDVIIRLSECAADQRVRYVSGTFRGMALSWWNELVWSMGRDVVMVMT
jgi:hypothetical protein